MRDLGVANVKIQTFDGTVGWSEMAPFDRILVTAAAPDVPEALLAQLSDGGRLVIPVGMREFQFLEIWTRRGEEFESRRDVSVAFVPLRGQKGWHQGRVLGRKDFPGF